MTHCSSLFVFQNAIKKILLPFWINTEKNNPIQSKIFFTFSYQNDKHYKTQIYEPTYDWCVYADQGLEVSMKFLL